MSMIGKISRNPNECEEQYLWRLGQAKDNGIVDCGWDDIADEMNREFRADESEYRQESAYRKSYQQAKRFFEAGVFTELDDGKYLNQIKDAKRELEKERIKVQTEKLEYNRWLRSDARDEMIADNIIKALKSVKPLKAPEFETDGAFMASEDAEGILAFGDEHYGTEFEIKGLFGETINKYNPDIFEERMWNLLQRVIGVVRKEGLTDLNVYSLGDFTDGVLRCGQLMKLRYGVVEGSVRYATFIAEWLNALTKVVRVNYQMVYGNHSELRMLGQPKGTFKNENTGLFVREIIKAYLRENPRFTMTENPTGLIFDNIAGFNVLGIHGEVKDMKSAIQDFSNTYNTKIDILIGGHMHHRKCETVGVARDVINIPSIIGIDDFSMLLNKGAAPGATMLMVEPKNGISVEYRLNVD